MPKVLAGIGSADFGKIKETGFVTKLHRVRTAHGERLTFLAPDYSVTIELTIRGLELDQGRIEQMLHAPLGVLVRGRM